MIIEGTLTGYHEGHQYLTLKVEHGSLLAIVGSHSIRPSEDDIKKLTKEVRLLANVLGIKNIHVSPWMGLTTESLKKRSKITKPRTKKLANA